LKETSAAVDAAAAVAVAERDAYDDDVVYYEGKVLPSRADLADDGK